MKLTPEQLEEVRKSAGRFDTYPSEWPRRIANDRAALLGHIDALEAELADCRGDLAAAEKQGDAAHAACVEYEVRVAALEATLRKADEIEHSISAEDWYKERDALLATAETGDAKNG